MDKMKTGIFVDSENIRACGGFGMRYDILRAHISGDGCIIKANSYIAEDAEKMAMDKEYKDKTNNFYSIIRNTGFKIIKKYTRKFIDLDGNVKIKANADLELAIDAMEQSRNLDRVVLLTGDGDFTCLVEALQRKGIRVEVISFNHTNRALIEAADFYISGYLIPNLLPIKNVQKSKNNIFRGTVSQLEKGYGFFTYYTRATASISSELIRQTIFFHFSDLKKCTSSDLHQKYAVFEFEIGKSKKNGHEYQAINIHRIDNIKSDIVITDMK